MDKYSISEFLTTGISFIRTKIFFRRCRLIRYPFYIRGNSDFEGGKNLTLGRLCRFELDKKKTTLFIGNDCEMGDMTHIVALNQVEIGNNVLVASKCFISDTSHGGYGIDDGTSPLLAPNERELVLGQVKIGNNVWIGENAVILSGANIGDGVVVGANCFINKDIPDRCIVVGNNKVIKKWNEANERWERYDG